jgi:hypothetical protein
MPETPTFENSIEIINKEISKKRHKWTLEALRWMDFEDVSQIIRLHIFKKWHLYDNKKKLIPWVNAVINNQMINLIRNHYGNFSRPCLKCSAAENEDGCSIWEKQCSKCPLYAYWEKNKKNAHDIKLPVSMENHTNELYEKTFDSIDIEKTAILFHEKMKLILKKNEWRVYQLLFIEYKTEEQAAKIIGYKTSEKDRSPGYRILISIRKSILLKARKLAYGDEIEIVN